MEKQYLFLQKDFDALEKKIAELKKRLETLFEWMRESARNDVNTWHDNYEFEEQQRQYQALSRQIQELQGIHERAVIVELYSENVTAAVGSRIHVRNTHSGEEKKFRIGSYLVMEKVAPEEYAYTSPFLAPFLGAKVGERRIAEFKGKEEEYEILKIE